MRKVSLVLSMAVVALSACTESFKKGDEGLEYKIISSGNGSVVKHGEFLQMEVAQFYNDGKKDTLLSDTRTMPQGSAFEMIDSVNIPPAYYKILSRLKKGDSLVLRILVDSAFKKSQQGIPPMFKKGNYLITTAKVSNVLTNQGQVDSLRRIAMAAAQEKQKLKDEDQLKVDDKILQEFFVKNNITAVKGPLGAYVQLLQPGVGPNVDTSVVVKVNYTGKTMDGKTFDSNTDPAFSHVQPYLVNMTNDPMLGNPVIQGWNDGLKQLNKGAKAKFYVPSSLAYGSQGSGPDIKPYSILVFDIEVVDILDKTQGLKAQQEEQKKMEILQRQYMDSMQKLQGQAQPQPGGNPNK